MAEELKRGFQSATCLWLNQGQELISSWEEIYKRFGIDGVIRIHKKDYDQFPKGDIVTHFNLEKCNHVPGKIYALAKIIIPGFFLSSAVDQSPLLDFSQCYVAQCLSVKEKIPYENLTEEDFAHSFLNIHNTFELKKEILWRYKQSLPDLSDEAILSLGVSMTTLKIIKKLD